MSPWRHCNTGRRVGKDKTTFLFHVLDKAMPVA